MNRRVLLSAALMLLLIVASVADAQQQGQGRRGGGGRGGFGFRGFGGADLLQLASMEAVQKEIEALEDQVAEIRKLREEQRGRGRGQAGARGRRQGGEGQRAQRGRGRGRAEGQPQRGGGRGARGEGRGGFGFSEEQMAEFRRRAAERAKENEAKLAEVLLPHQMDRLKEIQLQQQGTGALRNDDVVAALKITKDQTEKIQQITSDRRAAMREELTAVLQSGDRQAMRDKMTEYNRETEREIMAVLTADQKTRFATMKGERFEMPANAFRFGGRGAGRGGRGGGGRGERPQRPQRPGSGN